MLKLTHRMQSSPRQLWLEIAPTQEAAAIAQSHAYSNDIARRNAYVSDLCLNTVVNWLQTDPDLHAEPLTITPSEADLPSIWELLPGAAIQLGQTKLALIPCETADPDEFCVPFEWLDIPNWAADYYLAVQMNLEDEEHWLRIWGFTTHQHLKAGDIDSVKRLYKLPSQQLTEDLNVLWTVRSLRVTRQGSLSPASNPAMPLLPKLSLDQLESLLDQLSQPTLYSPRLEVPFDQWAAVLANDRWRQLLYERRQQAAQPQTTSPPSPVNLRQWLQRVHQTVEDTWQTVETIVSPLQASPVRGSSDSTLEAIAPILRLVQTTASEQIRQQAAGILGEIGSDHPEAVTVLVELLQTAQKEETRWQAALSLGKIAPQHPLAGVRRARLIDLGLQLDHYSIALIVAIMPKISDRMGVFLQVQSADPRSNLPPHLKISVLSESGETRLQAEARSDEQAKGKDQSIDLRFSPPAGTRFQVKVELNHACVTEEFLT
jgi:Protein of unknown function (DUF1822)